MALTGTEVVSAIGVQSNGRPSSVPEDITTQSIGSLAVLHRGTFVCNGVTPVTVSYTGMGLTTVIVPSLHTVGGTVGAVPAIQTVTAGTGFTIAGTAADTSTYNWIAL